MCEIKLFGYFLLWQLFLFDNFCNRLILTHLSDGLKIFFLSFKVFFSFVENISPSNGYRLKYCTQRCSGKLFRMTTTILFSVALNNEWTRKWTSQTWSTKTFTKRFHFSYQYLIQTWGIILFFFHGKKKSYDRIKFRV